MTIVRRVVFVCLLLPVFAFAQSADQEVVSVVDSPDPITPGSTLTYTITMTNHGPDPAVNGGLNTNLPGEVTYVNTVLPPGFSCFFFGSAISCVNPAWTPGTVVFTMTVQVLPSLAAFPDGSFGITFSSGGTTPDPNAANNSKSATTNYDTQQVDLTMSVTDSPDPVFPDGTVTYSGTATNAGPDTASSVNLNVVPNPSLAFQSATFPVGWSCVFPSVGAQNATFTCSRASWAPGADNFTVVYSANDENFGIIDTPFQTFFNVFASASDETDDSSDNATTVTTQYTTPDADMTVAVTDSPDPVTPDNDITYTVTVENDGPDAAPNAALNVYNNGTLLFQSVTVPAGWNCTPPAVNAAPIFTCTNASFANGGSSVFTVVVRADDAVLGINDGTVSTAFSVGSGVSDPNNANNGETENTAYVTPDADMTVAVTDSPDPVTPDNDITYTVTVENDGPDTAPNAALNVYNNGTLLFQSVTVPAGWNCTPPAVNAAPIFTCTNASFANGGSSVFTVVVRADDAVLGINDGTVSTAFTVGSGVSDPNNANNSETEDTAYVTPDADISVTNSDSPDPVAPGDTITYTQSITNNGPDAATNATFTQSTPSGTTFQSLASPAGWSCATPAAGGTGVISCTKGSMAASETGAFTLVVNVTGGGTITSTVAGGSSTQDPDPTDNTAQVTTTSIAPAVADLGITKTTATTNAPEGSTFSYTIVVTNHGPDAAANVVMTDVLPSSLLFRSITTPAGFTCSTPAVGANGTITCNAATLAFGASATFTLVVEVADSSGTIANTATASSDATDANAGNDGSTSAPVVAGPAQADLEITKTTPSTYATPGSTVTYTITVTNAGPSPATNVVVTDDLPSGLSLISATPSQGTCNASDPVTCNLGTIANGGSATITLSTQVTATSGTISNTASVTSSEGDSDSSTSSPIPVGSAEVAAVPTLSEWALMLLVLILAIVAAKGVNGV